MSNLFQSYILHVTTALEMKQNHSCQQTQKLTLTNKRTTENIVALLYSLITANKLKKLQFIQTLTATCSE